MINTTRPIFFANEPNYLAVFLLFILSTTFNGVAYAESKNYGIELGIGEYSDIGNKGRRDVPVTAINEEISDRSTTDHSMLKALLGPFTNGPDVTRACLECHNKAGDQSI